jgi:tetratricopeptide (TPR) repeat protein
MDDGRWTIPDIVHRPSSIVFLEQTMTLLGNRIVMMVGVALLLVAAGFAFAPVVANQMAPQTNAQADGTTALSGGAPASGGYTDRTISEMQARVAANSEDYMALASLGIAYLQKVRESNDPTYYTQAEEALNKSLALKPDYYDAVAAFGSLELSRHQFADALRWGIKARDINPHKSFAYGVIGDAQIELGKYDEAVDTFQQMVDLRPDLSSYARVSYARELYGDVPGAIEAMQQAVESGSPAAENTAWTRVQLGNLYFNSNQLDKAEAEYNHALTDYPNYLHALAGLAAVMASRGETDAAVKLYKQSLAIVPMPQYLTALGDLYTVLGDTKSAKEQYDLVAFTYKLFEANGVNAGVEKAAFLADQNQDAAEAVKLARAAAAERDDVHTLDTLAWALYRAGQYNEALEAEQRAMRLGTQNALFYFHAGMIYNKLGDHDKARQNLQKALDINPHFNLRYAKEAQEEIRNQKSEIRIETSDF